jgi:hypothetical protein
MRHYSTDLPEPVDWASGGTKTEPTSGEKANGAQPTEKWPAPKLNWVWAQIEDLGKKALKALVGTHYVEERGYAVDFAAVAWVPNINAWVGVSDATSGNLYFSFDGSYWQAGAFFSAYTNNPDQASMAVTWHDTTNMVVMFCAEDVSGNCALKYSIGPNIIDSGVEIGDMGASIGTGSGWVFTRKENTQTEKTIVSSSTIYVRQDFLSSFAAASGFGSVTFRHRVVHYADTVWYGIGFGASGYRFCKFYDNTADLANGADIYGFATLYADFKITCLDINPNTGRVIVLGTDSDTYDLLRILYSDDFGVTWTDSSVPTVDMGAPSTSTTIERISYIGGSCWVAHCRAATGYTRANNVFYSVDDGDTWQESQEITALSAAPSLHIDSCFNGKMWLAVRYHSGETVQIKGSVIP